jgi:hypothetical protein
MADLDQTDMQKLCDMLQSDGFRTSRPHDHVTEWYEDYPDDETGVVIEYPGDNFVPRAGFVRVQVIKN